MLVEVMLGYYVFVENESKNLPLLITIRFDWKFTKQGVPVNLILMLTVFGNSIAFCAVLENYFIFIFILRN